MDAHNTHYTALGIEPWEIMENDFTPEEFRGFLKGNILKYLLRNKEGLKDYEKLATYANKLVDVSKHNKEEVSQQEEEPKNRIDWDKVALGTLVQVRNSEDEPWRLRAFKRFVFDATDPYEVWSQITGITETYKHCKLLSKNSSDNAHLDFSSFAGLPFLVRDWSYSDWLSRKFVSYDASGKHYPYQVEGTYHKTTVYYKYGKLDVPALIRMFKK